MVKNVKKDRFGGEQDRGYGLQVHRKAMGRLASVIDKCITEEDRYHDTRLMTISVRTLRPTSVSGAASHALLSMPTESN